MRTFHIGGAAKARPTGGIHTCTIPLRSAEAPPSPVSNTALQAIADRLARINEDAGMTSDRLQRVLMRAFGTGPSDPTATGSAEIQAGEVAAIGVLLDSIERKMGEQAELLFQLDTLV